MNVSDSQFEFSLWKKVSTFEIGFLLRSWKFSGYQPNILVIWILCVYSGSFALTSWTPLTLFFKESFYSFLYFWNDTIIFLGYMILVLFSPWYDIIPKGFSINICTNKFPKWSHSHVPPAPKVTLFLFTSILPSINVDLNISRVITVLKLPR